MLKEKYKVLKQQFRIQIWIRDLKGQLCNTQKLSQESVIYIVSLTPSSLPCYNRTIFSPMRDFLSLPSLESKIWDELCSNRENKSIIKELMCKKRKIISRALLLLEKK